MQLQARPRRKVVINITSLIDVIFMLLLFFMISSTFLEQPGIKLELPAAKATASAYGTIATDVTRGVLPSTIWVYNGIRKLIAELSAPATRNAITAFRSSRELSTSRCNRGVLPRASRRSIHTKKAWPSTTPMIRKMGTGDRPSTLNGAAGVASTRPHRLRLLKAVRMSATARADSTTPTKSILMFFWRGTGARRKLRTSTRSDCKKIKPNE